jgi:hydroxycarboxylate dehydrogenase B
MISMGRLFPHQPIADFGAALFCALGADREEADIAAGALVQSSLMGHDSHGVLRIPEYLGFLEDGSLKPRATMGVCRTGRGTASVDCGYGFGAVGGQRAMEVAVELAREQGTACVITRRCSHVGRLGAYVESAARAGLIALATCNSPVSGHFVLPFGGRAGRLATNPIAYGLPSGGEPIVADFSTSVAPEGKIRVCLNEGKPVPEGWILDAAGNPTTDPRSFYGPPRGGILPLGGAAGHKGFALGLLVEVLGSALAGVSASDGTVRGNGVCLLVVDPATFCPLEEFLRRINETILYIKSSPPAPEVREVLVPGELEFRTRNRRLAEGIPIDEPTLSAMSEWARRLGAHIPWKEGVAS